MKSAQHKPRPETTCSQENCRFGSICTRVHQPFPCGGNEAQWRPKASNRHMMGMKQDRSYVSEVKGSDVSREKCVSQGAESPRADENELPRRESFHFISLFAIFSEPGEAAKSPNRPPSDPSRKRHHGRFLPPQTWRKRLFVAAQSRCAAFHPSAT